MRRERGLLSLLLVACLGPTVLTQAGNLVGYVRDQNWFARRLDTDPFGVGYYEVGVNANGYGIGAVGAAGATDVFGRFPDVFTIPTMENLPAGNYTVASWSIWWRPAYAFNVPVLASGSSSLVDLRLKALMWGYPAFWDTTGYYEFGQTFVASGSISMIFLRDAAYLSGIIYTVTVREGGPGGPQVGVARSFAGGLDQRLQYAHGEMPTVAGRNYYIRVRTSSPSVRGVLYQMDPRPDFSDPMPGGCLWLDRDGTRLTPYPDRDLGLIIMCNDDGLLANFFTRRAGTWFYDATSVGQTFVARGVAVISAAVYIPDAGSIYVLRIRENGPGGPLVGTSKRARLARWADPELIATWAPGECRLTPGNTYYLEALKDDGTTFTAYHSRSDSEYPFGQAYRNGVAFPAVDLAGTIIEEETSGSATQRVVKFVPEFLTNPPLTEANRGTNHLTIQWTTDVASDSLVEYAVEHPPYTMSRYLSNLVVFHSVTITGLQSHTLYHYRVTSAHTSYRAAVSRDFVVCTKPSGPNLLANPGFEEGAGPSPRKPVPGWSTSGSVDMAASDGTWFWGLDPRTGGWLFEGAINGSNSDGYLYQRVGVIPGKEYTFSAWVMTAPRENNTWKYDVWNNSGALIYMRLGIDPAGGTNPTAASVRWTPRMYSHRRWTQLAKSAVAQGANLTVFIHMKGDGVQWHLYVVDDCALTHEDIPTRFLSATLSPQGFFETTLASRANRTNVIELSTNLANWVPVANVLSRTGLVGYTNGGTTSQAFFRARTLP